ncbi:MAG: YeeE/YedE family protein [Xanthomonadales bacterium]|nr:YeeE/YedE family protein [Gammaproteobacteria bacterium]MBT8072368.1 YeeE/YedE family protein [Gammaproteobacteria bacterium]NNK03208.1 YeeE/YedE family protein [Xanthomonadales bacterium]NNK99549.1 YeeE/YedE family protein [Xanthomonadales bacterium]
MMEWEPVYRVALLSLLLGTVFGAVVNKTNFCTMGAVSDWVNMGNKGRLRAWFLAIGIAILVTQTMQYAGLVDVEEAIYLTANFSWLGHLVGGCLFGVGMTLASGCANRTLVRVGGGNLKSLVVMIFLGLTAYMTMRGLLSLVKTNVIEVTNIDLAARGVSDQGIPSLIGSALGMDDTSFLRMALGALMGGGLVVFALAGKALRRSFNNILAGITLGLIIPAGWYITGVIGFDDFDPARLESYTFTAPTAESLMYLMTFTGSTISFGVSAVSGVILGSFLYVIMTGKFRLETFAGREDLVRHMLGGIFMGFGGVLALGCTIGQAITGMSTLALGSLLTLVSIIFGSALTMKFDYYRMDDLGFFSALRLALADMRLFPSPAKKA